MKVTGTEDFALMQQIQSNLDSGAVSEVVYGRNEPPLVHYHRELNHLGLEDRIIEPGFGSAEEGER